MICSPLKSARLALVALALLLSTIGTWGQTPAKLVLEGVVVDDDAAEVATAEDARRRIMKAMFIDSIEADED